MLRSYRKFEVPELDAYQRSAELRSSGLRIGRQEMRRMMTDWGVIHYTVPFVHQMHRSCLSIVLEGEGRFEEQGKRVYRPKGTVFTSNSEREGTEAYAPVSLDGDGDGDGAGDAVVLVIDWDTHRFGVTFGEFESNQLSTTDLARIDQCTRMFTAEDDAPIKAAIEILNILRSAGVPIANVSEADLLLDRSDTHEADQRLLSTVNALLSNLEHHPSINEISDELGWSDRHTNRRLTALGNTHNIPWPRWRTMLHATRMSNVLRLLSVPGATTELVAKKTGFRSPSALCHALTKANLPSPSALAKACQSGALGAWTSIADRQPRMIQAA